MMKPRRHISPDNWVATIGLIVLALLGLFLWFKDHAHRPTGDSRVDWPAPSSVKP